MQVANYKINEECEGIWGELGDSIDAISTSQVLDVFLQDIFPGCFVKYLKAAAMRLV